MLETQIQAVRAVGVGGLITRFPEVGDETFERERRPLKRTLLFWRQPYAKRREPPSYFGETIAGLSYLHGLLVPTPHLLLTYMRINGLVPPSSMQ